MFPFNRNNMYRNVQVEHESLEEYSCLQTANLHVFLGVYLARLLDLHWTPSNHNVWSGKCSWVDKKLKG